MSSFFFFNDTATTEIYTLSLHDALPILMVSALDAAKTAVQALQLGAADYLVKGFELDEMRQDRKSTRLNSSHSQISYAVFCLKKKKKNEDPRSMLFGPNAARYKWRRRCG